MTFERFKRKWENKTCDFDGSYGGQCVDLYRMYCQEVLEVPQSPLVKGAKNIWDTYLPEHFTRVENTPTGVPKNGDIMIWGMGTYGHVSVFENGDTKTFNSFDQNYPVGSKCHTQSHTYKDVLGWLVYTKPMVTDPATTPAMEELNRILQFVNENKITEGQLREGFAYVKNETVPKLEKKVKALDKKQVEMDKKIVELETKYAQKEELEQSYQSAIKTANSKIIKLAQKSDDMEKERDDWRKRYNDKNVEYNELLVKKNMAKAKIILSDVYKKDLRVLGFLFIFGGVTFISQRFLNASDFWSVLFGGIANYIVFRVREELNKEGYTEAIRNK